MGLKQCSRVLINSGHYTALENDSPAGYDGAKVDKETDKGLSENDFTDYYKDLLVNGSSSLRSIQQVRQLAASMSGMAIKEGSRLAVCSATNTYVFALDANGYIIESGRVIIATSGSAVIEYFPELDEFWVFESLNGNVYRINATARTLNTTQAIAAQTNFGRNWVKYYGGYIYYTSAINGTAQHRIDSSLSITNLPAGTYYPTFYNHNGVDYWAFLKGEAGPSSKLYIYRVSDMVQVLALVTTAYTVGTQYNQYYYDGKLYFSNFYWSGSYVDTGVNLVYDIDGATFISVPPTTTYNNTLLRDGYNISSDYAGQSSFTLKDSNMLPIDSMQVNITNTVNMIQGVVYDSVTDTIYFKTNSATITQNSIIAVKI